MSVILEEHDYIGLSGVPSMENSDKQPENGGLNLKATELRLGLPGSESPPERDLCYLKGLTSSGAKRGCFFNTINTSSGKWVFSDNNDGSELDLAKNGGLLFSPRGGGVKDIIVGSEINSNYQKSSCVKESINIPLSPKPAPERKPQITAPAAKAQLVGWPPVRSFRKNSMASSNVSSKNNNDESSGKMGSDGLYVKVSMDGAPYLRKVDLKMYSSYMEMSSALEKMFSSCFTIGKNHGDGLSGSKLMDLLHGSEYVLTYEDKDGDWMLVGDVPWQMFMNSCKRMRIMKSCDAIGLEKNAKNP